MRYQALVLIHLTFIALFVAACVYNDEPDKYPDVVLEEWHHGYLGDLMALVGVLLGWFWVAALGTALRIDDTYQHARQWAAQEPGYRSPLYVLYSLTLYRLPSIRWLNSQLDKLIARLLP